ncbi:LamG domain-containing protein [Winogradskyella sp. MH6]|uniref:LamG domain-containing protein n=1 Tax=Winogradskyella sp. MH6 TaxID=2929510 RepID=UPI001FB3AC09|nr:LamG domain-containing protein [Winogradskyella sp. MH6]
MKKTLITLILINLLFSCSNDESANNDELNIQLTECIPINLQNSVVAYYPFTNGSINDFSGNSQNLVNNNASSTSDRNGNENCAFEFDFLSGTNENLYTSNTSSLDVLTDFSISLWYQPLQERDAGDYELLIGRGIDFQQWNLGLYDCRKAVFGCISYVWDNDTNFDCGVSDINNEWHHLVATYNYSTSSLALYRNGVLQETINAPNNSNSIQIADLIIGNEYTGKIDDIAIFNISLNQLQVTEMFEMETCCS